ncbi:TonB-dependent receptor [Hymenobacter sp. 5317J-9]|uniref:SusC/RagA family TonB-linked outer membrane protein n=1 Tax=Hymenobacter sp. 5317J-9 TaxID=2932250 RepID=UPI001FD68737|nr:TonB-dependent receptor [Hymenobacter sp. 5317J-9]UOQ98358.1 TonB-dependent receptor [Hymenobacter sp. 5317J-9]
MKNVYFSLLLWLGLILSAAAQGTVPVSGRVTAADGSGLPGVTVLEKGTNNGTTSDVSGAYSLGVQPNATLVFSSIGMKTQEVPATSGSPLNLTLAADTRALDEVVVVGYQTKRKADLTGSIAVLDVSQALKETNANLLTSIQGRLPGVTVSTDGAPGSNTSINIRGLGSINNNSPLYVVDGVPAPNIDGLNPFDIETFQVLKDAAAASIYGARSSNGVILITTKKGKSQRVQVTLDAYYGTKTRRNHLDMLNAQQYGDVLFQGLKNDGLPQRDDVYGAGPNAVVPQFLDDAKTIPAGDVDYQKEVYRPAQNQNYNVGISKASEQSTFFLGLNYNREEGLAKYTDFQRITARVNTSFNLADRLTVGENLLVSNFGRVDNPEGRTLESILYQNPIIPLYDNAGNFGGPVKNLGDRLSPLGQLYRARDNRKNTWRTFGNVFANLKLVKGLTWNNSVGVDANFFRFKNFEPRFTEGRFITTDNFLTESQFQALNTIYTSTLNYNWTSGKHSVQALLGYERIHNRFEAFDARAKGFFLETPDFRYLDAGSTVQSAHGGGAENALISQFARLDYGFRETYLLSATVRRDASSRFGPANRHAVFPAFSAAWRAINESFLKDNGYLTDLKFRASWGRNGNQEIGDYTAATFYASRPDFSNYDLAGGNGAARLGFITTQIGNQNIKWETAEQLNFGIDLGALDNRLTLTADYFVKNTKDLLVNPVLLATYGEGAAPFINAGSVRNRGLEMILSYRSKAENAFQYGADFNFTHIRNEVIALGEDGKSEIIGGVSRIAPGQPLGAFYGYVADGLFRSTEEVTAHADQPGKAIGRIRYKDLNGDGVIDVKDRQYIGSPFPDYTLGLNLTAGYKGFDLAAFWDASVGNDIYDFNKSNTDFLYFNSNHGTGLLTAFSAQNPDSNIPALTTINTNDELRASSYFISKGSYLRLKSLVLGYSLPQSLTGKLSGLSRVRFYVQGQNLLNFTSFKGLDYEVLNGGTLETGVLRQTAYPHSKSLTVGANVTF